LAGKIKTSKKLLKENLRASVFFKTRKKPGGTARPKSPVPTKTVFAVFARRGFF
jgi:hypothetical protein